jgi:hypothetical protein
MACFTYSSVQLFFGTAGPILYLLIISGSTATIAYKIIGQSLPGQKSLLKLGFALFSISVPSYLYDSAWTDEGISYIFTILLSLYFASNFARSERYSFACGFFAALAVNIHLKSVGLIAAIFLSIVVVGLINQLKIVKQLFIGFIGFIFGCLVTELVFQTMNPRGIWPLSWYYQLSLLIKLRNGVPGEWIGLWQLYQAGKFPYFVLAPLVSSIFICCILMRIIRKYGMPIQVQVFSFFGVFGTIILFVYQEVLRFPVVTTFWYYGTFNVVLFALLASMTWIYYHNQVAKFHLSSVLYWVLPVITVLPVWVILPGSSLDIGGERHTQLIAGSLILLVLIILYIFIYEAKRVKTVHFLIILIFCSLSISQFGNRTAPFRWREIGDFKIERQLFSDEVWLLDIWSEIEGKNFKKDVAIWYENDPNGLLGSVQSSAIFADTRLTLSNTLTDTSFEEWANLHGRPKAVIYMFIYHRGDNIEGSKESIDYFADKGCKARVTTIGRPPYRDIEESPSGQIALFNLFCE